MFARIHSAFDKRFARIHSAFDKRFARIYSAFDKRFARIHSAFDKRLVFWTDPKDLWPINSGPISSKAETPSLATLLATYLLPARGVREANETGSKELQCLFAHSARSDNKLPAVTLPTIS
jgi:hypothetical protein